MNSTENATTHWSSVGPVLDEALHELAAADRDALLLRYFEGRPLAAIGSKLGLSEKTVANHQSAIREKLGARNGVQLARVAAELGLSL